jgi:hypothetical protein
MEEEKGEIKAILLLKWRIMNRGLPELFAWCCKVPVTQCGASLHRGSLIYHYPTQEGNIYIHLSLMQIFFIVFLCSFFSVICCLFLKIPWFSCCHFLWRSAAYRKSPWPVIYPPPPKKTTKSEIRPSAYETGNISWRQNYKEVHIFKRFVKYIRKLPVSMVARSKKWVCGRSLARIAGSNPAGGGTWLSVCCQCPCLCEGPIDRPEHFYRMCVCVCVCMCDVEVSTMKRTRTTRAVEH